MKRCSQNIRENKTELVVIAVIASLLFITDAGVHGINHPGWHATSNNESSVVKCRYGHTWCKEATSQR
ncbi:MAG: hypothetical protein FWD15_05145 [Alphaproteobacteria bacterium]|nr:hypothetical protein [Alphaproteobacteria bacterium]